RFARVLPRSFPILDKVAQILDADPSMRVRIEGHGDWRGGHYINLYLSERRARYVRIYLMEKGIAPGRLQMKGMGRDHPIADNETEEGMTKNRRVEFHILKD
ncbi:MAG: OmpA family protein, partial [Bradymonadaceae bacterium]